MVAAAGAKKQSARNELTPTPLNWDNYREIQNERKAAGLGALQWTTGNALISPSASIGMSQAVYTSANSIKPLPD